MLVHLSADQHGTQRNILEEEKRGIVSFSGWGSLHTRHTPCFKIKEESIFKIFDFTISLQSHVLSFVAE